jgi:hypothetical protein
VSCTVSSESESAAADVANRYFESIRKKDFDTALNFYAPQFFERTPQETWLQNLKKVNDKLGDLKSYELVQWEVRNNIGTSESGTFYILQYKVVYAKQSANERITLFKPVAGGEIKILGHNITWEPF